VGRVGTFSSLIFGLAMIPLLGTWGGGASDPPLLLLDLPHGLAAIALVLMLGAIFRVSVGLSERNVWSRLGSVRLASRAIAAMALLSLVLAPLAIGSGSLRLHEVVLDQQQAIAPIDWLLSQFEGEWARTLRAWPIPAWNLLTQPLTALLFVPAMSLISGSARVDDPTTGAIGAAGFGLDSDPLDAYWSRLETRLSLVLSVALFVTLFLGASSIPFVDPAALVSNLEPYIGIGLPRALVAGLLLGSFLAKCVVVLALVARCKRFVAAARVDRSLRLVTRRLLPLAWANLLLVSGLALWWVERAGGLAR
jgi:NADH:ubiquinone oxidoreductase subunit H